MLQTHRNRRRRQCHPPPVTHPSLSANEETEQEFSINAKNVIKIALLALLKIYDLLALQLQR